jgi:hypothetical protein
LRVFHGDGLLLESPSAFFFCAALFFGSFLLGMTRQNNTRANVLFNGCSHARRIRASN